jgi:hypothetical protein
VQKEDSPRLTGRNEEFFFNCRFKYSAFSLFRYTPFCPVKVADLPELKLPLPGIIDKLKIVTKFSVKMVV